MAGEAENWVYILGKLAEMRKNRQRLAEKMHALSKENGFLGKKAEAYKSRLSQLEEELASVKQNMEKCRDKLEKLKEIDLELNRKKEDNLNGEGKNSGS